jgi:hypothetical protein
VGGDNLSSPDSAQCSSTSSASAAASPPETPTITNSQDSYQVFPPASVNAPESPPQESSILPLADRVPDMPTLVEYLRGHHRIIGLLSNPNLFKSDKEKDDFVTAYFAYCKGDTIPDPESDEWFWEDARDFMFEALCEHIPSSRNELKKCREAYFRDGMHLVKSHFYHRLLVEYTFESTDRKNELRNLSGSIGHVFLELFEQLVAPPKGKKILLINSQLDDCIKKISTTRLEELFEDDIAKRIYYISGFLCRAGEKEADRRSKDKDSPGYLVGQCIKEVSSHFVAQTSSLEVNEVKSSLPAGLADLVDKWSVHGCLKYPKRQLYSLVAKIEYCYSNLATAQNLATFGGIVVSYICREIAQNDVLISHFSSLLREDQYNDKTIHTAFKYYVQVFGNLRVKDLSRKFNAKLYKSTTAALRPSLATKGKTKRDKAKSKSKVKRRPRVTQEEVVESDESVHNALIDIAEESMDYDSSSDDKYIP